MDFRRYTQKITLFQKPEDCIALGGWLSEKKNSLDLISIITYYYYRKITLGCELIIIIHYFKILAIRLRYDVGDSILQCHANLGQLVH